MEYEEILRRFVEPSLTEQGEEIRKEAISLAGFLISLCPDSRELSIAVTKLEEVVMWANAAIARNE